MPFLETTPTKLLVLQELFGEVRIVATVEVYANRFGR